MFRSNHVAQLAIRREWTLGMTSVWTLIVALAGCGAKPPRASACSSAPCVAQRANKDALRVALASQASSVCIDENGCAGEPKGSVRRQPLKSDVRKAIAETLAAAGFEVVEGDAEAMVEVEWRGTETITLGVHDLHGRLIDQVSYRRSLEECKASADTSPASCWAANWPRMKAVLTPPLQSSEVLRAFNRRAKAASDTPTAGSGPVVPPPAETGAVVAQLGPGEIQDTVSRYREQLRRTCWMPALEARAPEAPRSARVSTTVSIDPSGRVDDVTAGAVPAGYVQLPACITSEVRSWRFPRSQQPTKVDIPFVFAGE